MKSYSGPSFLNPAVLISFVHVGAHPAGRELFLGEPGPSMSYSGMLRPRTRFGRCSTRPKRAVGDLAIQADLGKG